MSAGCIDPHSGCKPELSRPATGYERAFFEGTAMYRSYPPSTTRPARAALLALVMASACAVNVGALAADPSPTTVAPPNLAADTNSEGTRGMNEAQENIGTGGNPNIPPAPSPGSGPAMVNPVPSIPGQQLPPIGAPGQVIPPPPPPPPTTAPPR